MVNTQHILMGKAKNVEQESIIFPQRPKKNSPCKDNYHSIEQRKQPKETKTSVKSINNNQIKFKCNINNIFITKVTSTSQSLQTISTILIVPTLN